MRILLSILLAISFTAKTQTYVNLPYSTDFSESGNDLTGSWSEDAGANYFAKRQEWANLIPTNQVSSGKALTFYSTDTIGYDVFPSALLKVNLNNTSTIEVNFQVVDNSSYLIYDTIFIDVSVDDGATFTNGVAYRSLWEEPHLDWNWNNVSESFALGDYGLTGSSTSVLRFRANTNFEFKPGAAFWLHTGHMVAIDDLQISELVTLPVEIAAFNCENNTIRWSTLSEVNNEGFQVLHSKSGENWKSIGFVDGKGNSNEQVNYKYGVGHSGYYKVYQKDFNGIETKIGITTCSVSRREVVGYYDIRGKELNTTVPNQIVITKFRDGSFEKQIRMK